jgi:LAO/AO transport system kinase
MVREIRGVLSLAPQGSWKVPILQTEAVDGTGVDALMDKLVEHRAHIEAEGTLSARRRQSLRKEVLALATHRVRRDLEQRLAEGDGFEQLIDDVVARKLDPASAAAVILEQPVDAPPPG